MTTVPADCLSASLRGRINPPDFDPTTQFLAFCFVPPPARPRPPPTLVQAPWTEADVYCFGVTAWETWTRTMPADLPPSTSKAHAESGGLPLAYAGLTAEMSELLKDCLVADPAARPKMDVILEKMKSIFQKAPQDSPGDEEKKKADEKLLHRCGRYKTIDRDFSCGEEILDCHGHTSSGG